MTNKRALFLLLTFLAFVPLLTSCESNRHLRNLQEANAKLEAAIGKSKKKYDMSKLEAPAPVIYQSNSLRSPFDETISFFNKVNAVGHPLEAFPISMLRYVGIVTETQGTSAYVMTPENDVFQVKIGDIIGDQYGKIIHIYPDRLEVVEESIDQGKKSTKRIVTLQLEDKI